MTDAERAAALASSAQEPDATRPDTDTLTGTF